MADHSFVGGPAQEHIRRECFVWIDCVLALLLYGAQLAALIHKPVPDLSDAFEWTGEGERPEDSFHVDPPKLLCRLDPVGVQDLNARRAQVELEPGPGGAQDPGGLYSLPADACENGAPGVA